MLTIPLILGMSGGEIAFILFIAVMVFGAEKIPDIARNLGKGIKTVRNATEEIKSEITKSSERGEAMKDNATKGLDSSTQNLKEEVNKVKEDIEKITGSVKRKF